MTRRIHSETVKHGKNAEHPTYADDRYIHCRRCGFVCHLDRDKRAPDGSRAGHGVNYDTTFTTLTDDEGWGSNGWGAGYWGGKVEERNEPIVQSGCPLCGTYLYDREVE